MQPKLLYPRRNRFAPIKSDNQTFVTYNLSEVHLFVKKL